MPDLIPVANDPFNEPPTNLIPVDHDPWADATGPNGVPRLNVGPIAKAGQTIQPVNVGHDIAAMPGMAANAVGEATGINDVLRAQTPSDVAGAALMAGMGMMAPEAKAAEEAAGTLGAASKTIRAFHGSPHDFDAFDMSKIGTGEGAQAYGHGLYFAENPATAESYKAAGQRSVSVNTMTQGVAQDAYDAVKSSLRPNEDAMSATRDALQRSYMMETDATKKQRIADAINNLSDLVGPNKVGKMYEVNINADPEHFLDWDKPLSEQSPKVQEALHGAIGRNWDEFKNAQTATAIKNGFIGFSPEGTTQKLREAGIPGIKYLDQGSRGKGEGTKNYVVFNDKIIDIVKKYGLAGLIAGGAAHFKTTPVDHDPYQ